MNPPETRRTLPGWGPESVRQEQVVETHRCETEVTAPAANLRVIPEPVQLAFGETAMARTGDAVTSVEAAKRVNFTKGCERVYWALKDIGRDATAEDIAEYLTFSVMMPNVVARRLTDLERLGLAVRLQPVQGKRGRTVHAWRTA